MWLLRLRVPSIHSPCYYPCHVSNCNISPVHVFFLSVSFRYGASGSVLFCSTVQLLCSPWWIWVISIVLSIFPWAISPPSALMHQPLSTFWGYKLLCHSSCSVSPFDCSCQVVVSIFHSVPLCTSILPRVCYRHSYLCAGFHWCPPLFLSLTILATKAYHCF